MINYFFLPLTELEFWIQLGIAQLIREYSKKSKLTLLLPDHPRLRGKYQDMISTYFDSVVNLPYFSWSKNWRMVLYNSQNFVHKFNQLDFPPKTVLFACGMQELIHFTLCRHIRALRTGDSHILVRIETFIDLSQTATIDWKQTFLMSAFSVPLTRVFTWRYYQPITKTPLEQKYYPKLYDVRINLEHTTSEKNRIITFNNLPFPLQCITPQEFRGHKNLVLDGNAILVFLDSTLPAYRICYDENVYWSAVNQLVQKLSSLYGINNIFVKLHPDSSDAYLSKVENMDVTVLDKAISAEEIYFHNSGHIRGVFSGASTSLITASWCGIPAYDCSIPLGYNQEYLRSMTPYFSHAPHIRPIKTFSDLDAYNTMTSDNDRQSLQRRTMSDLQSKWNFVFSDLENKLSSF